MDADFGISKALPSLPQEEQDKVVQFLKDQGVNEEEDLKIYTEEDFTKRGLLKPVKAKRLIQFWKKGWNLLISELRLFYMCFYK